MSEFPPDSEAKKEQVVQVSPLVKRTTRELPWPLAERLGLIVQDCKGGSSRAVAAARGLLSASKLNLDNISATIKADDHTDLERRLTALEQGLDKSDSSPKR
jgi:hypothetical protein